VKLITILKDNITQYKGHSKNNILKSRRKTKAQTSFYNIQKIKY